MAIRLGSFAPALTDEERNARIVIRSTYPEDDFRKVWGKLSKAIQDNHNVATDRLAGKVRRVAAPFSRVAFLSRRAADDLAHGVQEQMAAEWGDLIHKHDFSVEAIERPAAPDGSLVSYFGFGVWAPQSQRSRIGSFRVRPVGGGPEAEPLLPDGRPAAWWDRQTGLAFSCNNDAALAQVSHPAIEAPGVFFFGKTEDHRNPVFVWLPPSGEPHRGQAAYAAPANWWTREGEWMRLEARGSRAPAFEFRFEADESPTALRRRKPDGPHLVVMGIYLPEPRSGAGVANAWLEVQGDGMPAHAPLMPKRRALIFDSGTRYALFERDAGSQWSFEKGGDHDFLLSNEERLESEERRMAVRLYSRQNMDGEDDGFAAFRHPAHEFQLVLAVDEDRPFGYVPLEPMDAGDVRDYRLVADSASGPGKISLRWLDEAVTVVTGDALGGKDREGLAKWALRGGGVTLTVGDAESWVREGPQDHPPVAHGRAFALGPLLVVLGRGASPSRP